MESLPTSIESQLVQWLSQEFGDDPRCHVPIGDDAAILGIGPDAPCVLTSDMLMAGVHFEDVSRLPMQKIGQKAAGVNLSDLAAMAANPRALLVSLAIPRKTTLEELKRLYQGIRKLADQFDVAIAGGDTNVWDGPLAVNVTAVGVPVCDQAWSRAGGQAGDLLVVTGVLGGSCVKKHWCPTPRVNESLALARHGICVHAAIDISDGLALDLWRVAQASGCGATLDASRIPLSEDAKSLAESGSGSTALDHALSDGEDFELLLAMPQSEFSKAVEMDDLKVPLFEVGRLEPKLGLQLQTDDGELQPLAPRGFLH